MDERSITDPEMLRRAKDTADQLAWNDLIAKYHPKLFMWAKHRGLQSDDAEEAASRVLFQLNRYLPTFEYDSNGKFRAWLNTVLQSCIAEMAREWKKLPNSTEDTAGHLLLANTVDELAGPNLLELLMSEEDYLAYRTAKERARKKTEEHVWLSWALTREGGMKSKAAADQLGIPIATLYTYVSRVNKYIEEEFRGLDR